MVKAVLKLVISLKSSGLKTDLAFFIRFEAHGLQGNS